MLSHLKHLPRRRFAPLISLSYNFASGGWSPIWKTNSFSHSLNWRDIEAGSRVYRRTSHSVPPTILRNLSPLSTLPPLVSKQAATEITDSSEKYFGPVSVDGAELAGIASSAEFTNSPKPKCKRAESSAVSAKKLRSGIDNEYPTSSPLAREILKDIWGYPRFRLKQEEVISRVINGGSAVVVFPTGGGKSLVYQVPALAFDRHDEENGQEKGGVTIVISPLIALVKVCSPHGLN